MIETPQILRTTEQRTAMVAIRIPASEIRSAMGDGLKELHAALGAQGISPSGPWFTHHLRQPSDTFDFEIHLPIESEIKPVGRVVPGHWPEMTVARTVYHGGYEGLGSAWGEFLSQIADQATADDLWEVYSVGPEAGSDASLYRTQLNKPLKD